MMNEKSPASHLEGTKNIRPMRQSSTLPPIKLLRAARCLALHLTLCRLMIHRLAVITLGLAGLWNNLVWCRAVIWDDIQPYRQIWPEEGLTCKI